MGAGWLPLESLVLLQDAQAERGQVPCPFYLCLANHDAPEDIRGPQTPCDQQRGCPQGQTTEASGRVALFSLFPLLRSLALGGAHPGNCSPATRSPSPPPPVFPQRGRHQGQEVQKSGCKYYVWPRRGSLSGLRGSKVPTVQGSKAGLFCWKCHRAR